jgi:hypothetical protein
LKTEIFLAVLRIHEILEKSSFVEKMENLPGESNKVPIYADVCKLNGKSAKISQENPGSTIGAKIRQTGSGKA